MTEKLLTVYATTQLIKKEKKTYLNYILFFFYFQILQTSCLCPGYPHI